MKRHSRSIYGCTQAPAEFGAAPQDCRYTYNPITNRLYLHLFAYPFKYVHLDGDIVDRIEYAQLLNDASEIKMTTKIHEMNYGAGVEGSSRKTLTLELPIQKPTNAVVPVVEMFLK